MPQTSETSKSLRKFSKDLNVLTSFYIKFVTANVMTYTKLKPMPYNNNRINIVFTNLLTNRKLVALSLIQDKLHATYNGTFRFFEMMIDRKLSPYLKT